MAQKKRPVVEKEVETLVSEVVATVQTTFGMTPGEAATYVKLRAERMAWEASIKALETQNPRLKEPARTLTVVKPPVAAKPPVKATPRKTGKRRTG